MNFIRIAVVLLVCGYHAPAAALNLDDYPALCQFIGTMAERHGFKVSELQRLFAKAEIKTDIIEAMERPGEALPWYQYKKNFVTAEHARKGGEYWRKHAPIVDKAAATYGVPAEIILAIIGVETQYGRNNGRYAVLDALTTLTLKYPSRADFFRRELEEFLLLARDLNADPLAFKGSYAGAIGIGQFMPSSYRAYAVDFDDDGRRDLIKSHADAIGSVANYFQKHGWQTGAPVIAGARVGSNMYEPLNMQDLETKFTGQQLARYGIVPLAEIDGGSTVNIIKLQEENGVSYSLGYRNFYVITRYNRSQNYAMAVWQLSLEILAGRRRATAAGSGLGK